MGKIILLFAAVICSILILRYGGKYYHGVQEAKTLAICKIMNMEEKRLKARMKQLNDMTLNHEGTQHKQMQALDCYTLLENEVP